MKTGARSRVEEALGEDPCAHRATREARCGNRQTNGNHPTPQVGRDMSMQLGNQRAKARRRVGHNRGVQDPWFALVRMVGHVALP